MLEPDQWDVLSTVTGTIYRGMERISSNALLNLLQVGPDPLTRQKVSKREIPESRVTASISQSAQMGGFFRIHDQSQSLTVHWRSFRSHESPATQHD